MLPFSLNMDRSLNRDLRVLMCVLGSCKGKWVHRGDIQWILIVFLHELSIFYAYWLFFYRKQDHKNYFRKMNKNINNFTLIKSINNLVLKCNIAFQIHENHRWIQLCNYLSWSCVFYSSYSAFFFSLIIGNLKVHFSSSPCKYIVIFS